MKDADSVGRVREESRSQCQGVCFEHLGKELPFTEGGRAQGKQGCVEGQVLSLVSYVLGTWSKQRFLLDSWIYRSLSGGMVWAKDRNWDAIIMQVMVKAVRLDEVTGRGSSWSSGSGALVLRGREM